MFIDSEHSLLSNSEIAHWKIKNIHCVGTVEFRALIWFVNNADIVISESELVCDSARELDKHLINSVDLALDATLSEHIDAGEGEGKSKSLNTLIQMANLLEVIMPEPDLCQNYLGKMISNEAVSPRTGNSSVRILNILMEQFRGFAESTNSTVRVA